MDKARAEAKTTRAVERRMAVVAAIQKRRRQAA